MSSSSAKPDYKAILLRQLHEPLKLRLCLSICVMVIWYFSFFSPAFEQIAATGAKIIQERKRLAVGEEIQQLRTSLGPHKGLIPAGTEVHELMRQVMEEMRSSPLKLVDLKPQKSQELGPYETLGIRLTLQGAYADIEELMKWVETDKRLLRIDSIKIEPSSQNPSQLVAQLVLLSLNEKAAAAPKPKTEAVKRS